MRILFLFFLAIVLVGCSDQDTEDPILCTEELVAGLEVKVLNGIGGDFLVEGVRVTAQDGEYQETLQSLASSNSFFGAFERAGVYIISVSKEGYLDFKSEPIIVDKDACHVITENIEVVLGKP